MTAAAHEADRALEDVDRITVPEAAWLLRMASGSVGGLCHGGVLDAIKVGGRWQISRPSVEAYAVSRQGRYWPYRPPVAPVDRRPARLPAAPLLQRVAARGGPAACGVGQGSRQEQALMRARRAGTLTLQAADKLAVEVLGLTPVEVWGSAFYD